MNSPTDSRSPCTPQNFLPSSGLAPGLAALAGFSAGAADPDPATSITQNAARVARKQGRGLVKGDAPLETSQEREGCVTPARGRGARLVRREPSAGRGHPAQSSGAGATLEGQRPPAVSAAPRLRARPAGSPGSASRRAPPRSGG